MRVIHAPPVLSDREDAADLCRQIQHEPTGADLVIDCSRVQVLGCAAARAIADHIFWRVRWSRVGCIVVDDRVAAVLAALHVAGPATVGASVREVLDALVGDRRPLPGGSRLIMGPGPARAA